MDIQSHFHDVAALYKDLYMKVLLKLYPAQRRSGFTEINQTVNFARAYEQCYPDAVSWFELPFDNKQRHDGLILDSQSKTLILIESKRFDNPKNKVASVANDVKRINSALSGAEGESLRDRIYDFGDYENHLGVILADVWAYNTLKKDIRNAFQDGVFVERYLVDQGVNSQAMVDCSYFVEPFDDFPKEGSIKEQYNLLAMIWRIQQEAIS